jgi:hypothetical protein
MNHYSVKIQGAGLSMTWKLRPGSLVQVEVGEAGEPPRVSGVNLRPPEGGVGVARGTSPRASPPARKLDLPLLPHGSTSAAEKGSSYAGAASAAAPDAREGSVDGVRVEFRPPSAVCARELGQEETKPADYEYLELLCGELSASNEHDDDEVLDFEDRPTLELERTDLMDVAPSKRGVSAAVYTTGAISIEEPLRDALASDHERARSRQEHGAYPPRKVEPKPRARGSDRDILNPTDQDAASIDSSDKTSEVDAGPQDSLPIRISRAYEDDETILEVRQELARRRKLKALGLADLRDCNVAHASDVPRNETLKLPLPPDDDEYINDAAGEDTFVVSRAAQRSKRRRVVLLTVLAVVIVFSALVELELRGWLSLR